MTDILLNNGILMPMVGLGTFPMKGNELNSVFLKAISLGYRSFDTAWLYKNEIEIGEAIQQASVLRSNIWLTSKVHIDDCYYFYHPRYHIQLRKKSVRKAYEESLRRLNTDYLDLYLIHGAWMPACFSFWKEMEELYHEGRIRAIGVSNFGINELQQLINSSSVIPAVNQIEISPYNTNKKIIAFCENHKIRVEAYSPFCRGLLTKQLLSEPIILEIAARKERSSAQIVLRWLIQQNIVVIPRSNKSEKLRENIHIFDFELSLEDMEKIDSLNRNIHTTGNQIRIYT